MKPSLPDDDEKPHLLQRSIAELFGVEEEDSGVIPGMAGAAAGLIAESIMHPFETISMRAKVHPTGAYGGMTGAFSKVFAEEGLRGLFAGVTVTALIGAPSTAVYFGAYEVLKTSSLWLTNGEFASTIYFMSGALSELFSSTMFVPFEVVKTRLQLGENPHRATGGLVPEYHNHLSIRATLAGIVRSEGRAGVFTGWDACLLQDMAFSAFQFLVYDSMKTMIERRTGEELTVPQAMLTGGAAGGLAAAVTNPLDMLASRMMAQGQHRAYGGSMLGVLKSMYQSGWKSAWRGTVPRAINVMPLAAVQFGMYELVTDYLDLGDVADAIQEPFCRQTRPTPALVFPVKWHRDSVEPDLDALPHASYKGVFPHHDAQRRPKRSRGGDHMQRWHPYHP